jgi:predicted tellurium resistance membrane protein TerC
MDTLNLISALFGGGAFAVLVMQIAKKALKDINDRYGALATQIVLFAVSFLIALGGVLLKFLPQHLVLATVGVFTSAIAIYEVLVKGFVQQALLGKTE